MTVENHLPELKFRNHMEPNSPRVRNPSHSLKQDADSHFQ